MQILHVSTNDGSMWMWVGVEIYFMIREHLHLATLEGQGGEKGEE